MGENRLCGSWRLVSSEFSDADGNVSYPWGQDAIGSAMFDSQGHISIQLMRAGRPAFATGDMRQGSPEEIKAAFEGVISYFGHYEVNEQEGTFTTRVQGSLFPNWIGGDQKRHFEFSADRMTMRIPPMLVSGRMVAGKLIWEHLSSSLR